MSFWDLSDGETAKTDKTEYEIPGGNLTPIPGNSDVLAAPSDAKWATTKDKAERYIEITWKVEKPEAYAGRLVFHKLWVDDLDPNAKTEEKAKAKRDKARRMLATIDANAGGKLMRSNDMPTDDDLALALVDKPMVIKVMLWEMPDNHAPGNFISGNWVSAVKPKTAKLTIGNEMPTPNAIASSGGRAPMVTPAGAGSDNFSLDDEIPF